jgi:ABC-2 type transport system ATP-binding protein
MITALEARALTKRYGHTWALRGCTLTIPAGHVVALVGPNGAGKSTLLHLAVGLTRPTGGTISVFGDPAPTSPASLARVGFVAQSAPLYRTFSVADMLHLGRGMNPRWDDGLARGRLARLDIPEDRKVGTLSGGQQAQVALSLALAKRPDLLLLDEPVADLDPLARHEFMGELMAAVAEHGISVVLSSHAVSELERTCDYLVVMRSGEVQVAGEVADLLEEHGLLTGPVETARRATSLHSVIDESSTGRQTTLIVRGDAAGRLPVGWERRALGLEELILAYLSRPEAAALPGPRGLVMAERRVAS